MPVSAGRDELAAAMRLRRWSGSPGGSRSLRRSSTKSSTRSGRCHRVAVSDALLIDANVLVYAVAGDERGRRCREILSAVAEGRMEGIASTAILEEVWHLELSGRIANLSGQTERAHRLLAPLLPITDETFTRALQVSAGEIGANDRIHVATCTEHGIEAILSADHGFDEVASLERVDPMDPRFEGFLGAPAV